MAGLAAKGPKQREGWRRLSVLFRDGKSRESSGRRKTGEDRHCKVSGGAADFRASRVLRGGEARALHGIADGFRLRTANTARTRASQTTLTSALAHALKEKAPGHRASPKLERRGPGNLRRRECVRGSGPGEVNALYAFEAEGRRGVRMKLPRRFRAIKPQIAFRLQGGALLQDVSASGLSIAAVDRSLPANMHACSGSNPESLRLSLRWCNGPRPRP